jgi:DinB superfamily
MSFTLLRSIEILERTPATLYALLHGLSDFWSLNNYGPSTFSPFDVVGHLIHAEQTNFLPRARHILSAGPSVPFPPFDRYAMFENSKGKSLSDLLQTFATLRAKNLADLKALELTPEQLDLPGLHPDLGPITLSQLLATWVVHDLGHLHQIAKSIAFQYREDVGVWREYLSILPSAMKKEGP